MKTGFPIHISESAETIQKKYFMFLLNQRVDSRRNFAVLLRKNQWRRLSAEKKSDASEFPNELLCRLLRTENPLSQIIVNVFEFNREVNPSDFLEVLLKSANHDILETRKIPSAYGTEGDFLSAFTNEGKKTVCRSLAVKDGNRYFIQQCIAPEENYSDLADDFLMAASSFRLTNPEKKYRAELLKMYEIEKPAQCFFGIPESWELAEFQKTSDNETVMNFRNPAGNNHAGFIQIAAAPLQKIKSHTDIYQSWLNHLEKLEIKTGTKNLEEEPIPGTGIAGGAFRPVRPEKGFKNAWSCVFSGTQPDGKGLDIRCCIGEHMNAWIFVGLAGVAREDWEPMCMINRRAYELALETLFFADKYYVGYNKAFFD